MQPMQPACICALCAYTVYAGKFVKERVMNHEIR